MKFTSRYSVRFRDIPTFLNFLAEYDSMEVPCGSSDTFAAFIVGCPTDLYQKNRFVQTQIALDEAIIAVSRNFILMSFISLRGFTDKKPIFQLPYQENINNIYFCID